MERTGPQVKRRPSRLLQQRSCARSLARPPPFVRRDVAISRGQAELPTDRAQFAACLL